PGSGEVSPWCPVVYHLQAGRNSSRRRRVLQFEERLTPLTHTVEVSISSKDVQKAFCVCNCTLSSHPYASTLARSHRQHGAHRIACHIEGKAIARSNTGLSFVDCPRTTKHRFNAVDVRLHERGSLFAHRRVKVLCPTLSLDQDRWNYLTSIRHVQHEHKVTCCLRVAGFVVRNPANLIEMLRFCVDHPRGEAAPELIDLMAVDTL